jgi:hypothetical protein
MQHRRTEHIIEESEDESQSNDVNSTIRFERVISVSIQAPALGLISGEQFNRLERIFDNAFNFDIFIQNFLENFQRTEELLANELSELTFGREEEEKTPIPSQEAVAQLPEVEI